MAGKKIEAKNDTKSDVKMVKRGVGQHETKMHPGKSKTKLKLGK